MINVLQIINSFDAGGAERVAINLALHLNRSKYRNFICAIDGQGPFMDEMKGKDVEVYSLDKGPGFRPFISLKLARYLRHKKIDIITSHNSSPFLYGRLACCFARVKAYYHVDHVRDFQSYKRRMIGNDGQLAKSINKVIAVSEDVKRNLMQYEGIDHDKIEVILNGIDQSKYDISIDKDKKKDELGINRNKCVIGTCVRLSEQKGLIYLLDAVRDLFKTRNDFHVLIVGDGPLKEELIKKSKEYGISDYIDFLGYRSDIPELLQVIDIYVLPSIFEGLPLALLEAMAAKKAIIATDVGDNKKVLKDGISSIIIPSRASADIKKSIEEMMDNKTRRTEMAEAAYREFMEKYTIDVMIGKYEKLYDSGTENHA